MSENLSEIVGQDVNLEADQPAPEAEQPEQGQEQPAEQQVSEQSEQQQNTPEARVVPLAALHEERQKRKELASRLERLEQERAQRDAVLEQRLAALAQAKQEAQIPAFEENPAEHLRHQIQQVQQTSQATAQQIQQWNRQQAEQAALQQLATAVAQHEAAFVQATPDYQEAVNHLRSQRVAELLADGADEVQATQLANRELMHFALTRAQQGLNPAEVAYKIAKARGYTAKTQQSAQPTPAERIQTQQRGVAAAKSLGSGGPANNKITAEALASMSDEEFAELTKGNNWQKLMGG